MRCFSVLSFLAALVPFISVSCGGHTDVILTEPLDDSAWEHSRWISVADAPVISGPIGAGERAADGASWFVAEVSPSRKVESARWMTTGLGVYQLYVNGEMIGREVLKPGFTHFMKTKIAYTYDITDILRKNNVLAAQVTPGWWADKIVSTGPVGMNGKKCAFRSVLELVYTDGSREYFGTDTLNWKAGIAGPVKHAAIFDGEEYDAREPLGFLSPEKLSTPEVNTEFSGEIVPTEGAEIYHRYDLALKPVRAYVWKDVEGGSPGEAGMVVIEREYKDGDIIRLSRGENLVVDFGQNCAAVPSFIFKADEGVTLTCLPAEMLNDGNGAESRGMDGPEGSVHRRNLRTHDIGIRLDYTFAGSGGYESYMPMCTFFGYRFINLSADGDVSFRSIVSIPVSSISEELETGVITTGNDMINKLISNTVWGQRSNYLSVPTDCPQRDERLGWTADTQVFAETGTFFASTRRFFHKWMRDMRDTQSHLGGFPGVAPYAQYGSGEHEMMRCGWADAGIIVPWTVWKQYGDTDIIEENWEAMEKFMDHIAETKYRHSLHSEENGNYQWADWLSYEPLESCSGRHSGVDDNGRWHILPEALVYWDFLCGSYWAIDAGMMRDMAAAAGRDVSKYETMYNNARDYLRETFLNDDGRFKEEILNTMQTPSLFALRNGLVDGEAKSAMIQRLRNNFKEHDGCLQTGFLGTSILMQTLTDNGMGDVAYDLLFQRRNPSWLYSVDNGATTIWERWNSYTIEDGMGPNGMNSFNHYAYGCVCQWIWETAAGICADPAAPGFRHIIMKPLPDRRLGYIDASFDSAAGTIRSSWRYEGDSWIWEFTIPEGSTARVTLPGETASSEYQSGSYTVNITL